MCRGNLLPIIPAREGIGLRLKTGQSIRIIDVKGQQVADLVAFCLTDPSEWLSNGRSFDYGGSIYFSTGDLLYSNKSRPMLSIVADDVGRHDFLFTPCSIEMYQIQYGIEGGHPNCLDNLSQALRNLGLGPVVIPTPFNVFMNVIVQADGQLEIQPPLSNAGDCIVLKAEMDLAIALSACPAGVCNGGRQKPIGYEIIDRYDP